MKKISILILIFTIPLIGFFIYMGGASEISVQPGSFNSTEVVFDIHRGSYQGLKKSWDEFAIKFKKAGLGDQCLSMGIYLDPPGTLEEKLRSIMACDITNIPIELKNKLKRSLMSATIPVLKGFQSEFPFKNELSFMFAAIMVYPKFQILIEEGKLKPSVAIESYGLDQNRSKIEFFMPDGDSVGSYDAFYKAFEKRENK